MSAFLILLRQAFRALLRQRAYTLSATLTLALGLVAAMGALVPAWESLGVPFDFQNPGRIVCLSKEGKEKADFLRPLGRKDFQELEGRLLGVEALTGCRDGSDEFESAEGPTFRRTAYITSDFFKVMGMPLLLGRDFTPEECKGEVKVVVLDHGYWMRSFGGDKAILGRSINLNGKAHEIVGVAAPQRRRPYFLGDAVAYRPNHEGGGWTFARLKPEVDLQKLQFEVSQLQKELSSFQTVEGKDKTIRVHSLVRFWRERASKGYALSMITGLLILTLACANVAHLMLARALGRMREWGLRAALGAGQGGILLPILTESSLLVGLGALMSILFFKVLSAVEFFPEDLFTGPFLLPVVAVLLLALLATSLLPLHWARRLDLNAALKEGGSASASRGSSSLRKSLTVFQIAIAFALLLCAGQSYKALEKLKNTDPGFKVKNLHMAWIHLDDWKSDAIRAFRQHMQHRLENQPGIESVGLSTTAALQDQGHYQDIWVNPKTGSSAGFNINAGYHPINETYLKTLGIPLLAGRPMTSGEADSCLVSAAFAQKAFGQVNALGQKIYPNGPQHPARTVVGIVGETRMSRFTQEALPAVYTDLGCTDKWMLNVYIRSAAPLKDLKARVLTAMKEAGGNPKLYRMESLEDQVARELTGPESTRNATLILSLLAALLAAMGLAGTLLQAARRQKREWGIRLALGASPQKLFGMVLLRVAGLLAAGVALGSGFAWGLSRLLQNQLHGVSGADASSVLLALLTLGLSAFLASIGPAVQVAQTNPSDVLRGE